MRSPNAGAVLPALRADVTLDIHRPLVPKGRSMLQESDVPAQCYDHAIHPDMAERGLEACIEIWSA